MRACTFLLCVHLCLSHRYILKNLKQCCHRHRQDCAEQEGKRERRRARMGSISSIHLPIHSFQQDRAYAETWTIVADGVRFANSISQTPAFLVITSALIGQEETQKKRVILDISKSYENTKIMWLTQESREDVSILLSRATNNKSLLERPQWGQRRPRVGRKTRKEQQDQESEAGPGFVYSKLRVSLI